MTQSAVTSKQTSNSHKPPVPSSFQADILEDLQGGAWLFYFSRDVSAVNGGRDVSSIPSGC